jgi:hypothetical protein
MNIHIVNRKCVSANAYMHLIGLAFHCSCSWSRVPARGGLRDHWSGLSSFEVEEEESARRYGEVVELFALGDQLGPAGLDLESRADTLRPGFGQVVGSSQGIETS